MGEPTAPAALGVLAAALRHVEPFVRERAFMQFRTFLETRLRMAPFHHAQADEVEI